MARKVTFALCLFLFVIYFKCRLEVVSHKNHSAMEWFFCL